MAAKSTDWRPGPTVCRCCLSEGCYKDISTEYFWMGKREVYSEMLLNAFNLTIAYSQSGGPNSNSRLICEPCISKLRDASDFKRQVQECERTFMQYLDPGTSSIVELEGPVENLDPQVKVESVKVEKLCSDDDFDDRADYNDDDDDDDLDDQPLTKLASKVPKKESVDLLDLLDNAKAGEKRKSTSKAKASPAKKSKTKKEVKATSSKTVKPEKKKKAERFDPVRANAEIIVRCTTAYPFRVNDKSILCVYCHELYIDPDVFRKHMDEEHHVFSLKVAFYNLPKPEFIKVDLTNLKCRLCALKFADVETVAEHLRQDHGQKINLIHKIGVMPYFLQKDSFNCAVCKKNCPSLFHLNRHTISHFLSYVCHVCGSSYIATTGLLKHVRSKHQDYEVTCKKCGKVFPTMEAKEKHRRQEKSCLPYCCPKCNERFGDWKSRKRHMEVEHGQSKRTYRCADCDISFANENSYYDHFKLQHSEDCATCEYCGLKFLSRYRLKRHMSKHVRVTNSNELILGS